MRRTIPMIILLLMATTACEEATDAVLQGPGTSESAVGETSEASGDTTTEASSGDVLDGDDGSPAPPSEGETSAESDDGGLGVTSGEQSTPSENLPPATTKTQMSYIFQAHPDDEFESWSTIEKSSGNYHVFVLLTRGGHTGYCENPANKPGMDNYPPAPRGSEECKTHRVQSYHRFLNRAGQVDAHLDVLPAETPTISDVDAVVGRYEVWVGANSARIIFDFPDGGLQPQDLVQAHDLIRSMKGSVLPDLPDYQALAASFWNATYPDCVVYTHDDHRAVHEGVWENDLDVTVQRGRTCSSDPDASYFRTITADTWRTFAGASDFLENGGDPGLFRESYGWLHSGWPMSEDESTFNSRFQSFWERRF